MSEAELVIEMSSVVELLSVDEVLSEVSENNFTGFILNPVALDEVFKIADLGERLPQKSTYFHPKLGSGLLFYPLIKDERG